jgi:hypothetical protein
MSETERARYTLEFKMEAVRLVRGGQVAAVTVFAPTNDAFAAIQSTVAGLTTAQLIKVLTYHVLPAQVLAANIPFGTPVATVEGETLTINSGTPPTITDKTSINASIVITAVDSTQVKIEPFGEYLHLHESRYRMAPHPLARCLLRGGHAGS